MKKQQGFTLIELVVVIVILGLLAATALPKFINVTSNARLASVQGVAGGLRSAVSLARSQYVLNGNKSAANVTMDGSTVTVLTESANTGKGGTPTADAAGIEVAMPDPDGFTVTVGTGVVTYVPSGGTAATCAVTYTASATPPVVIVNSNGSGGSGC